MVIRALAFAGLLVGCLPPPDDVPGNIQYTPALAFGSLVGQTSATQQVLVHNVGPGRSVPLGMPEIVGAGASHFAVADTDCTGMVMEVEYYCHIWISYTPSDLVRADAEVHVEAGNDGPLVAKLTGIGVAPAAFAPGVKVSTGTIGDGMPALADFNGDGKTDIAIGGGILMSTAVAPPAFTAFQVLPGAGIVAATDINADGKPDLVGLRGNDVSIAINQTSTGATTPSFAADALFGGPVMPNALVIADVNGDMRPDVVEASRSAMTISALINNTPAQGSVSLASPVDIATGAPFDTLATGDINGDGLEDLAYATGSRASVLINTTSSAPAFKDVTVHEIFGYFTTAAQIGDFNADGSGDVAYVTDTSLSVALNDGASSFRDAVAIPMSFAVAPLRTADLNGDGALDLVEIAPNNQLRLDLNATAADGDIAGFAGPYFLTTGVSPGAFTAGDVNGDGKVDLVVSNTAEQTISIFLAQ